MNFTTTKHQPPIDYYKGRHGEFEKQTMLFWEVLNNKSDLPKRKKKFNQSARDKSARSKTNVDNSFSHRSRKNVTD